MFANDERKVHPYLSARDLRDKLQGQWPVKLPLVKLSNRQVDFLNYTALPAQNPETGEPTPNYNGKFSLWPWSEWIFATEGDFWNWYKRQFGCFANPLPTYSDGKPVVACAPARPGEE
jgi:hypothetical protein